MGLVIASTTALSVAANSKSSDQVSGSYQFVPFDGTLSIAARGSATGLNLQVFVDGQAVMNDLPIPYTGTAGALSLQDHFIASIPVTAGSRVEFFARNTTGGALTVDSLLMLDPEG